MSAVKPTSIESVAIIGAGFAGLACARELASRGVSVTVHDKGRGAGGRSSTRRLPRPDGEGELSFDHGAQYLTARSLAFRRQVSDWIERGVAAAWTPRIVDLSDGHRRPKSDQPLRHVGVPGMSALLRDLERGLDVHHGHRVTALERDGGWRLRLAREGDAPETAGPHDAVVVAAPAPQSAALLTPVPELRERVESARMAPSIALLLAFPRELGLDFDAAFVHGSPISWMARNSSKPGRDPEHETWVLHATPSWSARKLERPDEEIVTELLTALRVAVRFEPPPPSVARIHRWPFARVPEPLDIDCLWDAEAAVGACGDWCAGERIERAWESGRAMAARVLSPTR